MKRTKLGTAWLFRDGELTLCHTVRLDWPEYLVAASEPPLLTLCMDDEIPLTKHRIDVYKRHGLRGKFPVYHYVRTDDL